MEDGTNAYRWLLTEEWEKAHWQEDGLDQTARTRITVTSQGDKVWVLAEHTSTTGKIALRGRQAT